MALPEGREGDQELSILPSELLVTHWLNVTRSQKERGSD